MPAALTQPLILSRTRFTGANGDVDELVDADTGMQVWSMLTYADVCGRMRTYADVRMQVWRKGRPWFGCRYGDPYILLFKDLGMLPAHSRMLTYADIRCRMLTFGCQCGDPYILLFKDFGMLPARSRMLTYADIR